MKRVKLFLGLLFVSATVFSQTSWHSQNSGTTAVLFDVHFLDQYQGWLCGNTGLVMYTDNGGENWIEKDAPPNNTYYAIHFTDDQNGWVAGYGGKIIHTSDGGETWVDQESGTYTYLYDFYFLNADTGWVVGGDNGSYPSFIKHRWILYTTDGGDTWEPQLSVAHKSLLKSVHFTDNNNGFAVGESGAVLQTTDGGSVWNEVMTNQSYHFSGVSTVNANMAFVVGEYLGLPHVPVIFRTTDGGMNWTSQTFDEGFSLYDINFPDEYNGWAVGGTNNVGTILRTSDGGETWDYEDPGTENFLFNVYFTDSETGWAVGQNGSVISTQLRTGISDVVNRESFQVYPNPATDRVNINIVVETSAPVKISLVNSSGQEVYRYDDQLSPGQVTHSINTQNMNSGFYFAMIENGTERISRKVVISK